jgi:hypothetical protein
MLRKQAKLGREELRGGGWLMVLRRFGWVGVGEGQSEQVDGLVEEGL